MAEADEVQMVGPIALPEDRLAGVDADERQPGPEEIDDTGVLFLGQPAEQVAAAQDLVERTVAVDRLGAVPLGRRAHEAVEHISPRLPHLAVVQRPYVRSARRAAEARHLAEDYVG